MKSKIATADDPLYTVRTSTGELWYFKYGPKRVGPFHDEKMARGGLLHLQRKARGDFRWETYFSKMLDVVRSKSKDTSTQVGCIIVGKDNEVRSTGYNGFPRGVNDDIMSVPERYARPEKYKWFEHAERNAIYNAARIGTATDGCRVYVTGIPCMDCARAIIQAGIIEVAYRPMDLGGNWDAHWSLVTSLFDEGGVRYRKIRDGGKGAFTITPGSEVE
jgi:dCMP deaminase